MRVWHTVWQKQHLTGWQAYVSFGLVLTVLALALHDRLIGDSRPLARVIAGWGILWSGLLIASGTIANMGMEYVVGLREQDAAGAREYEQEWHDSEPTEHHQQLKCRGEPVVCGVKRSSPCVLDSFLHSPLGGGIVIRT